MEVHSSVFRSRSGNRFQTRRQCTLCRSVHDFRIPCWNLHRLASHSVRSRTSAFLVANSLFSPCLTYYNCYFALIFHFIVGIIFSSTFFLVFSVSLGFVGFPRIDLELVFSKSDIGSQVMRFPVFSRFWRFFGLHNLKKPICLITDAWPEPGRLRCIYIVCNERNELNWMLHQYRKLGYSYTRIAEMVDLIAVFISIGGAWKIAFFAAKMWRQRARTIAHEIELNRPKFTNETCHSKPNLAIWVVFERYNKLSRMLCTADSENGHFATLQQCAWMIASEIKFRQPRSQMKCVLVCIG